MIDLKITDAEAVALEHALLCFKVLIDPELSTTASEDLLFSLANDTNLNSLREKVQVGVEFMQIYQTAVAENPPERD